MKKNPQMGENQPPASELLIYPSLREDGVIVDHIYHTDLGAGEVPPYIFVVGDPTRAEEVAKCFDKITLRRTHREFVIFVGEYHGIKMAVIGTGIGTDNIEITMVELYAVLSYLKDKVWVDISVTPVVIRLGTSGCPQESIPCGSLAISSYAVGLDNTGLFYLDRPIEQFVLGNFEEIFYTPPGAEDQHAREIWVNYRKLFSDIFPMPVIQPYVSKATPEVVQVLEESCRKYQSIHPEFQYFTGITTSASGFFANQGRILVGSKLENILFPDMQEKLGSIKIGPYSIIPVDNEMESSTLFRICQILGWKCGTICLVLANRKAGDKLDTDDYKAGVEACIQVGLSTMEELAKAA